MAQNENISLSLGDRIDVLNKSQSVDARYGVYDSEAEALLSMNSYGLDGRLVAVYIDKINGKVKVYTYNQVLHQLDPIDDQSLALTLEQARTNDNTVEGVILGSGEFDKQGDRTAFAQIADVEDAVPKNISELINDAGYTTNTGTVTSVGLSVPTGLSISGSPVTSSGTLAVTYAAGYQGYTTTEASKLSGIEAGAQVNVNADWDATSGDSQILNKPTLLELGETPTTAYRGDRGKEAYDHISLTNNPHNVTKTQVGLGNVDDTSDLDKPISNATQNALNAKADDNTVVKLAGNQTVAGIKTFSSSPRVPTATTATQAVNLGQLEGMLSADNIDYDNTASGLLAETVQEAVDEVVFKSILQGADSEETIKFLSIKNEIGVLPETVYFVPKSHNTIYNGQLTIFKYPSNTEAYPEENDLVEGFMNEVIVDPITEEETYTLWFVRGKYLGTGSFFNIENYELLNGSAEWE